MNQQEIKQLTDAQLRDIIITGNARIAQIKQSMAIVKDISEDAYNALLEKFYQLHEEYNDFNVEQGQRFMQAQRDEMTEAEWSSIVD
jgi:hypothetical protein